MESTKVIEELSDAVGDLTDVVSGKTHKHSTYNDGENDMSQDIIGLANLLKSTNTSGMDLPAIMALCKDNGFGGGNDFMVVLIFLLLLNNGGLFGNQRAEAATALGGMENLQVVTSLYDRIAASQAATTQGFSDLNTYLCTAISNVMGAVRDQGDRSTSTTEAIGARNYDAIRNVGDAVRECCCKIENQLISLGCKIDKIIPAIELSQERTVNAMQAMESRLALQAERNQNDIDKQFCALNNKIDTNELSAENRRLREMNESLRDKNLANSTAQTVISTLENFIGTHYKPTAK